MTSKTLIASVTFLLLYSLSSCKKSSNNSSTPQGNVNKLKLYIEDGSQLPPPYNVIDTFTVTYDDDNRLTGLLSPALKRIYTYPNSTSFTNDLYENNVVTIHEIAFINSQSYIDSTYQYNNTNDTTTEKYIYTGKLLTGYKEYEYSSTSGSVLDQEDYYSHDANGNIINDTETDTFGGFQMTTYTYTNKLLSFSTKPFFYPLPSTDLPATATVSDEQGDVYSAITYSYLFDSSGRVTQETDYDSVSGYTAIKKFVYE